MCSRGILMHDYSSPVHPKAQRYNSLAKDQYGSGSPNYVLSLILIVESWAGSYVLIQNWVLVLRESNLIVKSSVSYCTSRKHDLACALRTGCSIVITGY